MKTTNKPHSLEWLATVRLSGKVKRTHIVPTIQEYTVADHTYNAMVIATELCKNVPEANETRVLKYLLFHDVEEVYTGDLPAYMKKHPDIASAIERIEGEWMESNSPESVVDDRKAMNGVNRSVAKIADSMELMMFCLDELHMGNRHHALLRMCERGSDYLIEQVEKIDSPIVRLWARSIISTIQEEVVK